jgi:SAM-dependent methyltransferase
MLVNPDSVELIDTGRDPYREAYEEMDFYNTVAADAQSDVSNSDAYEIVSRTLNNAGSFTGLEWLDSTYEIASQADAYEFISPIKDMKTLQLGGKGIHAVKFLLAGASESWLLTPMLGEAMFARDLAAAFGVADKFRSVVGIAEEVPLSSSSFDRVYAAGCVHHMITERAFPEVRRILTPGGKFAAIEPWRAPMYGIGTKVFGKRERVNCRPMELERLRPLFDVFDDAIVTHHGTFTRYPLIALGKMGIHVKPRTVARITQFDDMLATKISLRKYGSCVAMMAESTG